jgi:pimeloyl-ACP methyl ester carboxylesterase
MSQVISRDGTAISYQRLGQGDPVILVDGALCSRQFGPMPKLANILARRFTVFMYDRRGRGESGDTGPYAPDKEVEDIAALIGAAGGTAYLAGLSSGAALALEAAASGLPVKAVAAYEPPFLQEDGSAGRPAHEARLKELIARGDRSGAVKYFMGSMVGVPRVFIRLMQAMFWVWGKLKAVAHTLPYDAAVMGDMRVPRARLATIKTRTLAMHGSKTDARLQTAARAVAAAIPGAVHKTLPGQTHNVAPQVLAPALVEFFGA